MNPLSLLALGALTVLSPSSATGGDSCASASKLGKKDVVTTAVEAGNFQTLARALGSAGLVETLKGAGPFTVFAPSDEAFAKLPKGALESLLAPENKAMLVELLQYHVVHGLVTADAVVKLPGLESLNGQRLTVHADEGGVRIGGARVLKTDIVCSNGVIHVLDGVLMPAKTNLLELAQGTGKFRTLLAAAQAAGLGETLATGGPFTLLAPTDEAFAKLPKGTLESLLRPENKEKLAHILQAHVLQGRVFSEQVAGMAKARTLSGVELAIHAEGNALRIGGAHVLTPDLQAKNGVVHVIDTVILPD